MYNKNVAPKESYDLSEFFNSTSEKNAASEESYDLSEIFIPALEKNVQLLKDKESIFISYRRQESADVTGRIYDRLVQKYGNESIFKDVDSIPLGVDFKSFLDKKIGKCTILLVVIGDQWLNFKDTEGNRCIDNPNDFVRIEIESALKRNIPIIPLLVRGAIIPSINDLPSTLKNLSYRNGTQIRPDPDFHKDMDRLIKGLEEHLNC